MYCTAKKKFRSDQKNLKIFIFQKTLSKFSQIKIFKFFRITQKFFFALQYLKN
jgi:hypothetical protein